MVRESALADTRYVRWANTGGSSWQASEFRVSASAGRGISRLTPPSDEAPDTDVSVRVRAAHAMRGDTHPLSHLAGESHFGQLCGNGRRPAQSRAADSGGLGQPVTQGVRRNDRPPSFPVDVEAVVDVLDVPLH